MKITFKELPDCLAIGEDRFDVDAHRSLGRVLPAHNGEAQALVPRTFLEADRLNAELLTISVTGKGAEARGLLKGYN